MSKDYITRQQYDPKIEQVPPELNSIGDVVYITNLPYDVRVLLFRDSGLGDKLVTKKVADDFRKGLERLASIGNKAFQEMLKRLPPTPPEEDIFELVL